jgi:hypothetical protein
LSLALEVRVHFSGPQIIAMLVHCIGLRLPDGCRCDFIVPVTLKTAGDAAEVTNAIEKGILPAGYYTCKSIVWPSQLLIWSSSGTVGKDVVQMQLIRMRRIAYTEV